MTDLSNLKLFATQPHPCSYLDDQEATTLFIDPNAAVDQALYTQLSQIGFRRSDPHLYRPHCAHCSACISCRIPVESFRPNRNQRRCWNRNTDLFLELVTEPDRDEHYRLYEHYINTRHGDGDMYPPSRAQYDAFLSRAWGVTRYLEVREGDQLLAVAVCDTLSDGLSAVYTFFDSTQPRRSLGVLGVLAQIEQARVLSLPYVYLGYWIKHCRKMDYKTQYRPLEMLVNRRWVRVT